MGQRKSKCVGDKRTAEKVAKLIEARLALGDLGILDEGTRRPFDDYYNRWLDSYVKAHCKDATYVVYETGFRLYLEPAFGKRDIGEITREDVKRLAYSMLAQGKSRTYVKGTLAPLVEMFNHAIEDGHVPANPTLRILRRSRSEEGERREKIAFLSRNELTKAPRRLPEALPGVPPVRPVSGPHRDTHRRGRSPPAERHRLQRTVRRDSPGH
jgi:hypothetical protein